MPYEKFDRSRLMLEPLDQREHDYDARLRASAGPIDAPFDSPDLDTLAERIVEARGAAGR